MKFMHQPPHAACSPLQIRVLTFAQYRRAAWSSQRSVPREKTSEANLDQLNEEHLHQAAQSLGNAERLQQLHGDDSGGEPIDPSSSPEVLAAQALRQGMMGTPIPLPYRAQIEARVGRSLAEIRCFTGPEAQVACKAVGAAAFAVGNVLVFAQPSPSLEIVLHEVLHALQQGLVSPPQGDRLAMGRPGDASEREVHALGGPTTLGEVATHQLTPTGPKLSGFFYLQGCSNSNDSSSSSATSTTGTKGIRGTSDGWLLVRFSDGSTVSLPSHLKVNHTGTSGGRDQFTILEGIHNGKTASVAQPSGGGSYLDAGATWSGGASATFDKSAGTLRVGSTRYSATTDSRNPIADGTHEIQIPDHPHGGGSGYHSLGTVWFRLGTSGDRYLHPGRVSAGCVTVTDTGDWGTLYNSLIKARASTTAVGTLTVTA